MYKIVEDIELVLCINEMLAFLFFALHIFYHFNEFFFAHVACPMVPKFYSFIIVNLRQSFYQCHPCCCNFATLQLYNPKREDQISQTNLFIAS